LDPAGAETALKRAVELILMLCPGAKVASNVVDVDHSRYDRPAIEVPIDVFQKKIGMLIKEKEMVDILERLGFGVKSKKEMFYVTVPSWRATKDISIAEDLVEEVARLYGYDHIVPDLPVFPIVPPVKNKLRGLARKIRRFLAYEQAYTEVYNYSFVSPEWLSQLHIDTDEHIELDNPIAKDRPLLRRNLIPNLLQNAESNLHRFESVKLFEVGRTYLRELAGERMRANSDDLLPKQDTVLGMVYAAKGDERPFYELAGSVRAVFERLGADISFHRIGEPGALPSHPGRYAEIKLRDAAIGKIGELHPEVQQHIGIPHRTAMLEIDMNAVLPHLKEKNSYTPLSTYPSVDRDIAFVVNRSVAHADIAAALRDVDPLVVDAALFDVYEGKGVPKGKKSMAYHLVYRSAERTLATEEVDRVHAEMVQTLTDAFDAEMRS
jgi:phenylalanyl-tRNA synthetase beta chain